MSCEINVSSNKFALITKCFLLLLSCCCKPSKTSNINDSTNHQNSRQNQTTPDQHQNHTNTTVTPEQHQRALMLTPETGKNSDILSISECSSYSEFDPTLELFDINSFWDSTHTNEPPTEVNHPVQATNVDIAGNIFAFMKSIYRGKKTTDQTKTAQELSHFLLALSMMLLQKVFDRR